MLRELAAGGTRHVVVAPIGFVCDHVEVLYDLDVEARATAAALALGFTRAATPNDHPAFIRMLAQVVRAAQRRGMTTRDVIVVGGGIAGLAAAHRLTELAAVRQAPIRVTLLEAASRVGGAIATERVDGFLVEAGADNFLTEKPWALALCHRLGLDDRLIATRDEQRRTFVVHDGRLHPLPEGFLLVAPTRIGALLRSSLFTWAGKLRMACDLVLPRGRGRGDESLDVLRRAAASAARRSSASSSRSSAASIPRTRRASASRRRCRVFLEMERRSRSLILGLRRQARAAARAERRALEPVRQLRRRHADARRRAGAAPSGGRDPPRRACGGAAAAVGGRRRRRTRLGRDARRAASACARRAWSSPRRPSSPPTSCVRSMPGSATELAAIPYASSAIVTIAYARADVPHPLDGFGFVVPAIERRRSIAGIVHEHEVRGARARGRRAAAASSAAARSRRSAMACRDEELVALARDASSRRSSASWRPRASCG